MHPILRIVRPHYGVDYSAPAGTPVYSIGDGKIISATIEGESGRIVRIRHNSVYSTAYLHLSGFAKGIAAGVMVRQGDEIGYVGSTGLSTGPHLDFRFYKNGYPVDPLKVDAPSVDPVLEENKPKFEKISRVIVPLLSAFD
jgi:murein DD-endopeptidase MepM/ murein hydrolase activator NlpD